MNDGSEQTAGGLTDGSTGVLRLEIAHGRAWLLLVGILASHVADEALTGFLDFYNPLVLSIRERIPWFPMPAFRFDVWLTGLIIAVVILALLTPAVRRGAGGTVLVQVGDSKANRQRLTGWAITRPPISSTLRDSVYVAFSRWPSGSDPKYAAKVRVTKEASSVSMPVDGWRCSAPSLEAD